MSLNLHESEDRLLKWSLSVTFLHFYLVFVFFYMFCRFPLQIFQQLYWISEHSYLFYVPVAQPFNCFLGHSVFSDLSEGTWSFCKSPLFSELCLFSLIVAVFVFHATVFLTCLILLRGYKLMMKLCVSSSSHICFLNRPLLAQASFWMICLRAGQAERPAIW